MTAKICHHVLNLRQQNLIALLAKLACVSLLGARKMFEKETCYLFHF